MVGELSSLAWRRLVTQKVGMFLDHAECVPKRQGFPASAQVNSVGCESVKTVGSFEDRHRRVGECGDQDASAGSAPAPG